MKQAGGPLEPTIDQGVRRFLPFARRRLSTWRPKRVSMRARNPWVRLRLISLGWNVRFMARSGSRRARDHRRGVVVGQCEMWRVAGRGGCNRLNCLSGFSVPESMSRQIERLSLFLLRGLRAVDDSVNLNLVKGLGGIWGVYSGVRYRPARLCAIARGLLTITGVPGVLGVIHRKSRS